MDELAKKIFSKKAILWDFDGCLCDSERIHFLAYAQVFEKHGHKLSEHEYYETFTHTGGGVPKEIEKYKLNCDVEEVRNEKMKNYWELIAAGDAEIYTEVPEILSILNKHHIINAIASNSPFKEISLILSQQKKKLKIDKIFGFEHGMRKKPYPDLYNKALQELKLTASEALVIEDSERGLLAAQRAGIESLWIKTPTNLRFEHTEVAYLARLTHKELLMLLTNK